MKFKHFVLFVCLLGIGITAGNKKGRPSHKIAAKTSGESTTSNSLRQGEQSDDERFDDKTCSTGESHVQIDSFTSCCNHKITLVHGLNLGKFWKECAVGLRAPKSKAEIANESYVNSTRRVYACVLYKHLRKQTTNLLGFATMMTANYPENIKQAILKRAREQSSTTEIELLHYAQLRTIRNSYTEIQKSVCTDMDTKAEKYFHNKTTKKSTECDALEEVELNGGSCCQGKSIPIDVDFWYPPPSTKQPSCNVTLAGVFKKWKIQEADHESAMEICSQACMWLQSGVLTPRALETGKMSTDKEIAAQMKLIAPGYLSPHMMKYVLNFAKSHNQTAGFESGIAKRFPISNSTLAALRPCIGYTRLSMVLYDALFEFCNPPKSMKDESHRVATKTLSGKNGRQDSEE